MGGRPERAHGKSYLTPVRGDIHWCNLSERRPAGREIAKTRPCVILSHTKANAIRLTVVVVPLTTGARTFEPIEIALVSAGPDSKAVCDQLTAIDKQRIADRIGSLSAKDLRRLEESIREVLGL